MPSYLIHFNRLHDKKGRFTYGDGDGDGGRNDGKRKDISQLTRGDGRNTRSNTKENGNINIDPRTGQPKSTDRDRYSKNPAGLKKVRYKPGSNDVSGPDYKIRRVKYTADDIERSTSNKLNDRRDFSSSSGNKTGGISSFARRTPDKNGGNSREGTGGERRSTGSRATSVSERWAETKGQSQGASQASNLKYNPDSYDTFKEAEVVGRTWVEEAVDNITDPEWWNKKAKKIAPAFGLTKGSNELQKKPASKTDKSTYDKYKKVK